MVPHTRTDLLGELTCTSRPPLPPPLTPIPFLLLKQDTHYQASNIKHVFDQTRLTYVAIFEGLIKLNDLLELLVKQGTHDACSNIKYAYISEGHSNSMFNKKFSVTKDRKLICSLR